MGNIITCAMNCKHRTAVTLHTLSTRFVSGTRCGNKETGLLLLLISGHVDDEEEGRALTRGLPSYTIAVCTVKNSR